MIENNPVNLKINEIGEKAHFFNAYINVMLKSTLKLEAMVRYHAIRR